MLNKVVLDIVPGLLEKGVMPYHPIIELMQKKSSLSHALNINKVHQKVLNQLHEYSKKYPEFVDFKYELKQTKNYNFYVIVGFIESETGINYNDYVTKNGEVYDIWELNQMELNIALDDEKKYNKFEMSPKSQFDQEMKLKIWQRCKKMKQLVVFNEESKYV